MEKTVERLQVGGWRFLHRKGKALLCLSRAEEEGPGPSGWGLEGREVTPVWTRCGTWPGTRHPEVFPVFAA